MKKTKRDVSLLTKFLQNKGETRGEIADIPPAELNEFISEFFVCVRTKEGQEYTNHRRYEGCCPVSKDILNQSRNQTALSMILCLKKHENQ